jgi:hypothetical protein
MVILGRVLGLTVIAASGTVPLDHNVLDQAQEEVFSPFLNVLDIVTDLGLRI